MQVVIRVADYYYRFVVAVPLVAVAAVVVVLHISYVQVPAACKPTAVLLDRKSDRLLSTAS